jgi:UDP:flavonoid glycosyltransferase YjiC (YdhE family)
MRVLAVGTSAGGGDIPPLVAVLLGLSARGHEITCTGDAALLSMVDGTSLSVEVSTDVRDLTDYRVEWERMTAQGFTGSKSPDLFQSQWAKAMIPTLTRVVADVRPDVVLCSGFTVPAGVAVKQMTGAHLCWINSSFYFGPGAPRSYDDDFIPRRSAFVEGVTPFLPSIDLVISGTDSYFDERPDPCPSYLSWVGPLFWERPVPDPPYVDAAGDPWILVSMSSARQEDELVLADTAIEALADEPYRVLVTLGHPASNEAVGAARLPGNAYVEPYLQHSSVLRRAVLSINHSGHGTVAKSMYFGVPMVLIPWGRDQKGVSARAERLGVAKILGRSGLTPSVLRSAVLSVLEDSHYRIAAASRSNYLQSLDPVGHACQLLEALVAFSR